MLKNYDFTANIANSEIIVKLLVVKEEVEKLRFLL